MRIVGVALVGWVVLLASGGAGAQHGPERLCVVSEGKPGTIEYKNACNHCVSVKIDLTNSDGEPETAAFEIPAKGLHTFETSNYPRVRVPHVDVCPAAEGSS